jgi:anaerobic selenocysteine-containing dehydrogenase
MANERLRTPLVRVNGQLEPTSWEVALGELWAVQLLQVDQRGQLRGPAFRQVGDGIEQHRFLQSNLTRSQRRRSGDSLW